MTFFRRRGGQGRGGQSGFKWCLNPRTWDDDIPVPSSPLPLSASPRRRSFGLTTVQQPSHRIHTKRHSLSSPHDSAVALSEVTSHPYPGPRNKAKQREIERDLPLPDLPVHSLPSPSPLHSHSSNEHDPHRSPVIPRIIHTPPTPQRQVDSTHNPPKTVTIAHREQVIVSNSHSHTDLHRTPSSKGRFTPRFFTPKQPSKTGQKSPKRPLPGSSDPSARNMTHHQSKLGSFDFERPVSALNKSNSTIDRRPKQSASDTQPEPHINTGDTSVVSFSSVSVQTMSTGKGISSNTHSSSWSRASDRRILRSSHGTFAFEHPSLPPSPPHPQNNNIPIRPNQGKGYTTPLHSIFDPRPTHSRVPSDHVEPGFSKPAQRKAKGKGRSLDLGLGLSWAPSRVREEVLMPGLILAREKAKLEKTKASGSDITKVFESILSVSQFETFKEYVHHFDAHIIPLEGPSGLLARVEKLLAESGLSEREREKVMSDFTVFVEYHGG